MSGPDPRVLELLTGGRPPAGLTREDRVRLLAEAAQVLLASDTQAGAFAGSGIMAWLANGGDLARDYFRVVKAKSHRTPAAIWRELQAHQDERPDAIDGDTLPSPPTE